MELDKILSELAIPKYKYTKHELLGGMRVEIWFENGQGASVINHLGSYGTELAVLKRTGPRENDFKLDYSTPITDDVVPHIRDEQELGELLVAIASLPPIIQSIEE